MRWFLPLLAASVATAAPCACTSFSSDETTSVDAGPTTPEAGAAESAPADRRDAGDASVPRSRCPSPQFFVNWDDQPLASEFTVEGTAPKMLSDAEHGKYARFTSASAKSDGGAPNDRLLFSAPKAASSICIAALVRIATGTPTAASAEVLTLVSTTGTPGMDYGVTGVRMTRDYVASYGGFSLAGQGKTNFVSPPMSSTEWRSVRIEVATADSMAHVFVNGIEIGSGVALPPASAIGAVQAYFGLTPKEFPDTASMEVDLDDIEVELR